MLIKAGETITEICVAACFVLLKESLGQSIGVACLLTLTAFA